MEDKEKNINEEESGIDVTEEEWKLGWEEAEKHN